MKRYFTIYLLLFLTFSCNRQYLDDPIITIDFKESVSHIPYSLFADSVSYKTLHMDDDSFISDIQKVFIDDDFIFLQDIRRGGIYVFSLNDGSPLAHLNYFGEGPGEFTHIRASTLDRENKQIIIFGYPHLHKYTYDGTFIESIYTEEMNFTDFHRLETGEFICICPEQNLYQPEGVWLTDSSLRYTKMLKKIPPKQLIYVISIFYNIAENGIYYYDPVWEDFSYITKDSTDLIYNFDFKQRIPKKKRNIELDTPEKKPYSFISKFAHSDQYLLLNYFNYDQSPSYWVFLDRNTNQTVISNQLINDLSGIRIDYNNLFHLDTKTWCRILDPEENNPNITVEFIHIK